MSDIRVARQKQVADCVSSVINNKVDKEDLTASLHRLYSKHEKHVENERDTLFELVKSTLILARRLDEMAGIIVNQAERINYLEQTIRSQTE